MKSKLHITCGAMRFNKVKHVQSKEDKEIVSYVLQRKSEMDTFYREKAVGIAKWASDTYESSTDDEIGNMDVMRISLGYPAVNQRCSVLFNNQSKAEYRTVDESKKYDVEILKKVDEYDKGVGRFNSVYQEIELTANKEGSCFFRVNWEEKFDKDGNTKGKPYVGLSRVRMNDIWWDQGARKMSEANHMLERKVMTYERYLRIFAPLDKKDGFKNIRAVEGMGREFCEDTIYSEEWEKNDGATTGRYVTLWYFESLGMIKDDEIKPRAIIIANGVVIYDAEKLFVPCKPGDEEMLSWSKIDGIPSGTMIGMSVIALIRHPQEAFDRLLTLCVAQAELAVVPPVIMGPGIDWDTDDYPNQTGTVIRTRGNIQDVRNSYHWFQAPDITQGAQVMMDKLIEYVIMLTGVDIRALFVPASEKAITTVNKREIQEKMLRFSVQWNEENGYYDLALLRLRFIQCYYPKRRTFLETDKGKLVRKERYLKVPVKDYETEEMTIKGQKKIKLNFKEGGYTKIDVTPENIDFNVDLVIEGATNWQERDSIQKKNFLEGLQVLNSIPAFQGMVDKNPKKFIQYLLKTLSIPEDEVFEEGKQSNQNMHPALKEVAAINLIELLEKDGFKFPDSIPEPTNYDPTEYVDIFTEVFRSDRYKTMTSKSKKIFDERFAYHEKNANHPYYVDLKEAEEEPPTESAMPTSLPPVEQAPEDLNAQVRAEGAQIANMTK